MPRCGREVVVRAAARHSSCGPTPASERVESEGYPGAQAVPCIQSMYNTQQTRYDVFMSNRNGLSVSEFEAQFDDPFLDETKYNEQFLYRYDFNKVIYCSKWGVKKVYCIIEDLL